MKVKMLESESGFVYPGRGAVHLRKGEVHEVPDDVGARWLVIGLAALAPVVAVSDNDDAGDARSVKQPRARARSAKDGD